MFIILLMMYMSRRMLVFSFRMTVLFSNLYSIFWMIETYIYFFFARGAREGFSTQTHGLDPVLLGPVYNLSA